VIQKKCTSDKLQRIRISARNLIGTSNQTILNAFAALFGQGFGEFFERAVGDGFAGE